MERNTASMVSTISLLAAVVSGCGLVKVNGKPLGGSSGDPAAATGTPATSDGAAAGDAAAVAIADGKRPQWCEDLNFSTSTSVTLESFADLDSIDRGSLDVPATEFAEVICANRGDSPVPQRAEILAKRQAWMTKNVIDERDFVVIVAGRKGYGESIQDFASLPGAPSQLTNGYASSTLVALDEYGTNASMLARFGLLDDCFEPSLGLGRWKEKSLLLTVLCTREKLDASQAYAEIDATAGINENTRYTLRRLVKNAGDAHAEARAGLTTMAAADPGIAALVAIADAEVLHWATSGGPLKSNTALLEAMEAATKANKHSAFEGCDVTTRAAWEAHLKGLTLPKVPGEHVLTTFIATALGSAEGYLAYQALRLCSASNEDNFYKGGDIIGSDVARRGPRTSTIAAWLAAAGDIKFDDRDLKMSNLLSDGDMRLVEGQRYQRIVRGIIDTVTEHDGYVEITFQKVVKAIEDCVKWKETGRIQSISAGGAINYEYVCTAWGKVKTDLTADPLKTGKVMAQGLTHGMYLLALEEGLPIVATKNEDSSKAIWVFGGAVN